MFSLKLFPGANDRLLSTHADRQSVDISVTVCIFFVCTVTDFSVEDKASGRQILQGGSSASWARNLINFGLSGKFGFSL